MDPQLLSILGLALAILLCAIVALLVVRRSSLRERHQVSSAVIATIGGGIAYVLYAGLLGFFRPGQVPATTVVAAAYGTTIGPLWLSWWRSRTQSN